MQFYLTRAMVQYKTEFTRSSASWYYVLGHWMPDQSEDENEIFHNEWQALDVPAQIFIAVASGLNVTAVIIKELGETIYGNAY